MEIINQEKKYLTAEEAMLYQAIRDYAGKNGLSPKEEMQIVAKHFPISESYAEAFRIFDGEEALKEIEAENIELMKKQEWIYGIQD